MIRAVRGTLEPWVTGEAGTYGTRVAQKLANPIFDLFFQLFPLLCGKWHYMLLMPFSVWFTGVHIATKLLLSLLVVFFIANSLKDILCLPRPAGVKQMEKEYLEEYGFPSTHSAASIAWAFFLHDVLQLVGVPEGPSFTTSVAYCAVVVFSRLYLGVHSLADVAGGITVGVASVHLSNRVVLPHVEMVLSQWSAPYAVAAALCFTIGTCVVYPDTRHYRVTYKDMLSVIGTAGGFAIMRVYFRETGVSLAPVLIPYATAGDLDMCNQCLLFAVNFLCMAPCEILLMLVFGGLGKVLEWPNTWRYCKYVVFGAYMTWLAQDPVHCSFEDFSSGKSLLPECTGIPTEIMGAL